MTRPIEPNEDGEEKVRLIRWSDVSCREREVTSTTLDKHFV